MPRLQIEKVSDNCYRLDNNDLRNLQLLDLAMVTLDEYQEVTLGAEILGQLRLRTEVGAALAVIERMPDQPH